MTHDTPADRNEPLAYQHRRLNDRQLMMLFECVCDDTKVDHWVCGDTTKHFDVTPDDVRDEINVILNAVDSDFRDLLALDYVLRMIAWHWELANITSGNLGT